MLVIMSILFAVIFSFEIAANALTNCIYCFFILLLRRAFFARARALGRKLNQLDISARTVHFSIEQN